VFDPLAKRLVDGRAGLVGPGSSIEQPVRTVLPEPPEPFAGGAFADARSSGGRREAHLGNALNE
jgi:hypothetical protein